MAEVVIEIRVIIASRHPWRGNVITNARLVSPARLLQVQAADDTVTASGTASIVFYPNGACQGGSIFLGGADDDTVAIELDPMTSLSKLLPNASMR